MALLEFIGHIRVDDERAIQAQTELDDYLTRWREVYGKDSILQPDTHQVTITRQQAL